MYQYKLSDRYDTKIILSVQNTYHSTEIILLYSKECSHRKANTLH